MKKSHDQLNNFPKEQVRSAIRQGITQAEAQISQKKNSTTFYQVKKGKRKILYAASSIAAAVGILIGSSYYSPALASNLSKIPIIGSVFGDSNLIGLQQAKKQGLTNAIGETQTINGISVTIDEILYDQNKITIGYIIESEKDLSEFYFGNGADITIDGEYPNDGGGGYSEDKKSPTTWTAIQDISVTEDMPNAFELGLIIHGQDEEVWYFSTPIKQITDISKIPLQHTEDVDGIKLIVTELSLSETGVSVSYESSEEGKDFEQSRAGEIEFLMVDQNGNEITSYSGAVKGEKVKNRLVFKSHKQFDPIDSNVTELTITPYLALPTDGGGVELDGNGELKELEFKKDALQSVEFESFKVQIPQ